MLKWLLADHFPGICEIDQLFQIFSTLGTPAMIGRSSELAELPVLVPKLNQKTWQKYFHHEIRWKVFVQNFLHLSTQAHDQKTLLPSTFTGVTLHRTYLQKEKVILPASSWLCAWTCRSSAA